MAKRAVIPCPARCGRMHEPGAFFCQQCWQRLPTHMQHALIRTWLAADRVNAKTYPADFLEALTVYRRVRDASVLFLTNLPKEPG